MPGLRGWRACGWLGCGFHSGTSGTAVILFEPKFRFRIMNLILLIAFCKNRYNSPPVSKVELYLFLYFGQYRVNFIILFFDIGFKKVNGKGIS